MVTPIGILALSSGTCLSSAALSELSRHLLQRIGAVDVPSERSLHSEPVVRGVGIAIAIAWIAGATVVGLIDGWRLSGMGTLVAMVIGLTAIGLVDDVYSVSAAQRLAAEIVVCSGAVWGGIQTSTLVLPGVGHLELGLATAPFCVLTLVSAVNLFNFMDGIDGLAGSEAALAGIVIGLAALISGADTMAALAGCLVGAALGFLPFNWSPARCFMGDAGSYFCGGTLAGLLLLGQRHGVPLPLAAAATVPFFLDPVVTLARRFAHREAVWRAHRSHFYQRLVAKGWSHARVTELYLATCGCLGTAAVVYLWRVG
jgi:UDP-N-acetylmuramyl pentapeptide phosphotransferase/UDP-N-acetylglucosamine-1-phosphate transferase